MEVRDPKVFLDYHARMHERTVRVVDRIPEADLEWSPGEGRFSFGDMLRHLAGIERYMYAEAALGHPNRYPGHGRQLADGLVEVRAYYDQLYGESREIFSSLSVERYQERVATPAGTTITLWKWLRAMLEHEAHHRGQLYMMLGLRGVATPPIYGLTSEEVRDRAAR